MRTIAWLLCIVASILTVYANVEKTIFLGPSATVLPDARRSDLEKLNVDTLEPAQHSILATQLSVKFPTESTPHGVESWYLLRGLEQGRRYEVRICWPAFQPTDFWLDTFSINEVFDILELASSLERYSDRMRTSPPQKPSYTADHSATAQSLLFLRVQAAASYFSTNETLMAYPPPVDVDIILDPFYLNILPRSLGPTAVYITVVALAAWYLSEYIYRWIIAVSREFGDKDHKE